MRAAGLSSAEAAVLVGKDIRTIMRWKAGRNRPDPAAVRLIGDRARERQARAAGQPALFTFIDLFAGIGGMRLGFQRAGGRCVFTCEWDRFAQRTYAANFPDDRPISGDITTIAGADIPDHDVLLAGFPCQPFSIAGVSKKNALGRPHGFACEAQGTLFFHLARIIDERRPRAFLLENVKNLQQHDRGNTFRVIKDVLQNQLGYTIFYKVVDARSFLPQHRERVFIAGFREPQEFDWDALPIPQDPPKLRTVLHAPGEDPEPPYTLPDGSPHPRYTLSDRLWRYLQDYAVKHRARGNGFGYGLFGPDDVARTLSARYYKDGSEILIAQPGRNPRRLTPRECARLMGFDRRGRERFRIPVSDTQAYRQFGNSVAVPVVEAIAEHMLPHIAAGAEVQLQLALRTA
jgi:DNA (cytosine-5)-methyltransferase 1